MVEAITLFYYVKGQVKLYIQFSQTKNYPNSVGCELAEVDPCLSKESRK